MESLIQRAWNNNFIIKTLFSFIVMHVYEFKSFLSSEAATVGVL